MSSKVRIVTDSACDLPDEILIRADIRVVPLKIRFGDEELIDRVELSNEDFWQRMNKTTTLPSTAAPSPGDFAQEFQLAADDGCSAVICINLSGRLSATFQAATTAARDLEDVIQVHLIDSTVCTIGQGALCLEAAKEAAAGRSAEEVVASVEKLRSRLKIFGALDTLDNLKKGGRIGAAGAFFGSLLSVKPIITLKDGEVQAESRQRTRSRALDYLASLVVERAPIDHVAVAHSNASDINEFLDRLSAVVPREQILVSSVGPVIGSHGGPGLIAVAFASD